MYERKGVKCARVGTKRPKMQKKRVLVKFEAALMIEPHSLTHFQLIRSRGLQSPG